MRCGLWIDSSFGMMLVSFLASALSFQHGGFLRTTGTGRVRTVAIIHEPPPGFETLMPQLVHHTPFSRHLFNAIMGYMALDTSLFAARIVKRRLQPGVHEAKRLAAAPTTKFGASATRTACPALRAALPELVSLEPHAPLSELHSLARCTDFTLALPSRARRLGAGRLARPAATARRTRPPAGGPA